MYDAKNEAHEFTAATREEAIRKAADYFGVGIEELRVGEFPVGAVYGLGGRTVVVASLRNRTQPAPGRSGGRDSGRDAGREERGRGERPRRGNDSRRGSAREDRGERGPRGGRESRGEREGRFESARSEAHSEPARKRSDEPSVGTVHGEVGKIGQFLLGVMERVDAGPFEISENAEGDVLVYELKGAAAAVLAGGEGRTVDALQVLANQVAQRNELDVRVVLDVEGSTDAREDLLSQLALRAASRALETGRSVALDPMNGRDRRTIHLALRDQDRVATMSSGEGRYRQVVIVPEGAPEYEQALQESGAARAEENS